MDFQVRVPACDNRNLGGLLVEFDLTNMAARALAGRNRRFRLDAL
jgi:hypothetical protein